MTATTNNYLFHALQKNKTIYKFGREQIKDLGIVIFPNSTGNLMATQIKSLELDFAYTQFL
jgi:hypothetical protein